MGRRTQRYRAERVTLDDASAQRAGRVETVAVEEPLEIRVGPGREVVTVTMRLPGDDFDLAVGHLMTEGLIASGADVTSMMHCTDVDASGSPTFNVVDVALAPGVTLRRPLRERTEIATGACGVCGTASVDDLLTALPHDLASDDTPFALERLLEAVEAMREHQKVFAATGGVHAAAIVAPDGELLVVREDIGRHNAVDKVVGWAVREGRLPLRGHAVVVSSRAGFEIAQKAAMAGAPVLACVSAPSSLAVDVARESGLTLVAFLRPPRGTVYSHPERLR